MNIKKYPQSHLLVTNGSQRLIIDPGNITFSKGFKVEQFQGADGYLITHIHNDHMGWETIKQVAGDNPVFGNQDVVEKLTEFDVSAVAIRHRQKFHIGDFEIEAVDLPHCKMQDGSDGPPNTGFLINGVLFHPGDGDQAPGGLVSPNIALPIAGPTITMKGALEFAKKLQAKVVIPIHYDYFTNDPEEFAKMAKVFGIEVRILSAGDETTI